MIVLTAKVFVFIRTHPVNVWSVVGKVSSSITELKLVVLVIVIKITVEILGSLSYLDFDHIETAWILLARIDY